MRDIVIASANKTAAERVRTILQSNGLMVSKIFASGSEVLSFASIRSDAVIVCGKLSDMAAVSLSEMLPNGYDMVWLLSSGQVAPLYVSNVIIMNMPLDRKEFINTVRALAFIGGESYERHIKRSDSDEKIISNAKSILMNSHHISEAEAHHIIQKKSMDSGKDLISVAKMIGEEAL